MEARPGHDRGPLTRDLRVLVVEDDPQVGPKVVNGLRRAGLDAVLAADGPIARSLMDDSWSAIVLDLMLPGIDGFTLLEQWRHRTSAPIIVLTADTRLDARLKSFELGAIDWLPKPFFMEELVTRIRARLGMGAARPPRRRIPLGSAVLDLDRRQVLRDEQVVPLTAHEVNLLEMLVTHPDRAFSRQQLADGALPADGQRSARTVDSHISHLRRKLGDDARPLETVYGIGYVWSEG